VETTHKNARTHDGARAALGLLRALADHAALHHLVSHAELAQRLRNLAGLLLQPRITARSAAAGAGDLLVDHQDGDAAFMGGGEVGRRRDRLPRAAA
jgi:hypothetical protein